MSMRVTDASARRMAVRDEFVSLTPGPYFTIEEKATGLPVVGITIEGVDVEPGPAFAARIADLIQADFEDDDRFAVRVRKTA